MIQMAATSGAGSLPWPGFLSNTYTSEHAPFNLNVSSSLTRFLECRSMQGEPVWLQRLGLTSRTLNKILILWSDMGDPALLDHCGNDAQSSET